MTLEGLCILRGCMPSKAELNLQTGFAQLVTRPNSGFGLKMRRFDTGEDPRAEAEVDR